MIPIAVLLSLTASIGSVVETPATGGRPARIVAPLPDARYSTILIGWNTGSTNDEGKPGLTNLSIYSLLTSQGGGGFAPMLRRLVDNDGSIEVEISATHAQVILRCSGRSCTNDLLVIAKRIATATPVEAHLDEAKRRTLHDVNIKRQSSTVEYLLASNLVNDQRLAYSPTGQPETIQVIEFDQVEEYAKTYLRPANATIIAAGPFSPPRVMKAFGIKGGRRHRIPRPRGQHGVREVTSDAGFNLEIVALRTHMSDARSWALAEVMTAMLWEAAHEGLRERGISYTVGWSLANRPWGEYIILAIPRAGQTPGKVQEHIKIVFSGLVESWKRESSSAFDRNVAFVKAQLKMRATDPTGIVRLLSAFRGREETEHLKPTDVLQALGSIERTELRPVMKQIEREEGVFLTLNPAPPRAAIHTSRYRRRW